MFSTSTKWYSVLLQVGKCREFYGMISQSSWSIQLTSQQLSFLLSKFNNVVLCGKKNNKNKITNKQFKVQMMHKWQVLGGKKRSTCQVATPGIVSMRKCHGTATEPYITYRACIIKILDINIFLKQTIGLKVLGVLYTVHTSMKHLRLSLLCIPYKISKP